MAQSFTTLLASMLVVLSTLPAYAGPQQLLAELKEGVPPAMHGSYDAKSAVAAWLMVERRIAARRVDLAGLAASYVKLQSDNSFTPANRPRLVGERLQAFQMNADEEAGTKEIAHSLYEKAQAVIAEKNAAPSKRQKVVSATVTKTFGTFIENVTRQHFDCEKAFSEMSNAAGQKKEALWLVTLAKRTDFRCSEAKLMSRKLPKGLPTEAEEWLESWLSELSDLAENRALVGKTLVNYAEDNYPGHLLAYRNERISSELRRRKAADLLIEARRHLGIKIP
jgi:hypothetical protein